MAAYPGIPVTWYCFIVLHVIALHAIQCIILTLELEKMQGQSANDREEEWDFLDLSIYFFNIVGQLTT